MQRAILCLLAGFSGMLVMTGPALSDPLTIYAEPYPGYAADLNGEIRGAGADQVHAIMKAAKIDYRMELTPWARAYSATTWDPHTCAFAANHTEERDKLFKWVEPLGAGKVVLIRRKGADVNPKTLEEARAYVVGVQRGDYGADYLTKQGFANLDFAADFSLTLRKLENGRIDLALTSEAAFIAESAKGRPVEPVMTLPAALYALICNTAVPDDTINALQHALNGLILNGTQDAIYQQYGMPAQKLGDLVKKMD